AKIAAGRDKPRGFFVVGAEARELLAPQSVRLLPRGGPARAEGLEGLGGTRVGHLQGLGDRTALRRPGAGGPPPCRRARGEDVRRVDPARETKSISAETTFDSDLTERADLEAHLWRLSEKLAARLKDQGFAAGGVVLKLKTSVFATRTRVQRLSGPT